jgi:hypothetical protein
LEIGFSCDRDKYSCLSGLAFFQNFTVARTRNISNLPSEQVVRVCVRMSAVCAKTAEFFFLASSNFRIVLVNELFDIGPKATPT